MQAFNPIDRTALLGAFKHQDARHGALPISGYLEMSLNVSTSYHVSAGTQPPHQPSSNVYSTNDKYILIHNEPTPEHGHRTNISPQPSSEIGSMEDEVLSEMEVQAFL